MKMVKKMLAVLLAAVLCAGLLMISAFAAEQTQDGLEVSLTTDKDTYALGQRISAVLKVTNTNKLAVNNVSLSSLAPAGYRLKEGVAVVKTVASLQPGETVELPVVYDAEPTKSPQTDAEGVSALWIVLAAVSAAGVAVLLVVRKDLRKRTMALVLCVVMVGSVVAAPAQAAAADDRKTIELSTDVTVNGVKTAVKATVEYRYNSEEYADADGDGVVDYVEELLGTDVKRADTDEDGLSDKVEIYQTKTDPVKADTDGDGTKDGDEDTDTDGLTNLEELEKGTNPTKSDTDSDGLTDGKEVTEVGTDPLKEDTDGDAVTDGREVELGTDPLTVQESFQVTQTANEEDKVTASVNIELAGEQVDTLSVEAVDNQLFFPEAMPGYMGHAYDFNVAGEFDTANISFAFEDDQLPEGAEPAIFYFNEETQTLEELATTVENGVATAEVEHFSTYILLDRQMYYDSFTWEDTWDSTGTYSSVEVVFVIDDSGSMGYAGDNNDPNNERLTVAQEMIDKLPNGSKIGVVWFASTAKKLTETLTTDKETAKAVLTTENFTSIGDRTHMYGGINEALTLFESTDASALRTAIVLTDGRAHDYDALHADTITAATEAGVRLYTVGLGDDLIIVDYLQPLAEETGGSYYMAQDADQLAAIYDEIGKMINLETDTDGDGIPDYYEDNMISFNGIELDMDKNSADSDGDGLTDSEEVTIDLVYSEDQTQVYVKGTLLSSPARVDTDFDGTNDQDDAVPLNGSFTGKLKTAYANSAIDCVMDYSWFFEDNTVYNDELSKLSLLFSGVIYEGHTMTLSDAVGVKTTTGTLPAILEYLGMSGAESVSLNDYYTDIHLTEAGLGYRTVVCGGVEKTILSVTVRGTNGTLAEWSSNCNIGDISTDTPDDDWVNPLNHMGFDICATRVLRLVDEYIAEHDLNRDELVYWVTGHSRGAAIANIVGANLEKAGETAFTYTFAAPNATLDPDYASYQTIFNVINEDDFVPCLPMEVWGYHVYGRSTTTASIKESYEKVWEKLTGIGDYNPDGGMENCVADIGKILPEGCDPRVECFRYTCACHGDGSNDTITIENWGMTEDSREKAIAKIPSNALPYCIIVRREGGWLGGWDFYCCQTPSYLMQLLAAFMGGEINAYRFAIELDIAPRYETAKGAIVSAGIGGIEHPHYPESYYVLADNLTAAAFG